MGRYMLIVCLGMVMVTGMVQMATDFRQVETGAVNVEYFESNMAENLAGSGIEMGINTYRMDDPELPYEYTTQVEGYDLHVIIEDESTNEDLESNQVLVTSETNVGGEVGSAEAMLKDEPIHPPIPGATGFYSPDSEFIVGGNAEIYGADKDGNHADLPAIAGTAEEDDLVTRVGGGNPDSVEDDENIEGDPDYDHNPDLEEETQEFVDFVEQSRENADQILAEDENHTGLGTEDDPRITVVDGDNKFNDTSGHGILYIAEGHELELRGDFSFDGIIAVEGRLNIRGSVEVDGSILFNEGEGEIDEGEDADGDFSGDAYINYSSNALANINDAFAEQFETEMYVDYYFQ